MKKLKADLNILKSKGVDTVEKEKKIFVTLGYVLLCVTKKECDLLWYLHKRNLLKFTPEEVKIYGTEE